MGVWIVINKIFVHKYVPLSQSWRSCCAMSRIWSLFSGFTAVEREGWIMKFMWYILLIVYSCVSYLPTTSTYLCPIHWGMHFRAENCILIISFLCCIIFDTVFIFFTVVCAAFYCCTNTHMMSRICCCVVSFIVINSYKITLFRC